MSIWYSISAQFNLRPDVDRQALAAAVARYEALGATVAINDGMIAVEAEGDMSYGTADDLRNGLVMLVYRFGDYRNGDVVRVAEHLDDERLRSFIGRKADVLVALEHDYVHRLNELRSQYESMLAQLATAADDDFVETEGW